MVWPADNRHEVDARCASQRCVVGYQAAYWLFKFVFAAETLWEECSKKAAETACNRVPVNVSWQDEWRTSRQQMGNRIVLNLSRIFYILALQYHAVRKLSNGIFPSLSSGCDLHFSRMVAVQFASR